jgi:hypothetical protein
VTVPYRGSLNQKFLLTADRHWDNPLSNHKMQRRHLIQAKKEKTGILDFGDLFCAMQGKYDKRSNKEALRPEHQVDDYLDQLVSTAADFFEPFARNIIMIAMGNHETSIVERHETNLTNSLVRELNYRTSSAIYNGGYSGWVVFRFVDRVTKHVTTKKLWYIHGYGGGGPVTRGVIQSNRRAVYLPDADMVVSGHTHDEWVVPIARVRLDENHLPVHDDQLHIQVPTYKDEYGDGYNTWHIRSGRAPKPIGALWLQFSKEGARSPLTINVLRAK